LGVQELAHSVCISCYHQVAVMRLVGFGGFCEKLCKFCI